jgi:hypothetical protein
MRIGYGRVSRNGSCTVTTIAWSEVVVEWVFKNDRRTAP